MEFRDRLLLIAACAFVLLLASSAVFAASTTADKTEAPYFVVKSGDPVTDRLPLKATDVDVKIAGVIADVKVTQRYRNEGTRPIEAKYVFPGSTRAAVYGMKMHVGSRLVEAEIREKQQARTMYEKLLMSRPEAIYAEQLADMLLEAQSSRDWTTLKPTKMTSAGGATLTLQADGSILASGKNPDTDTYTLVVPTDLKGITGLRLEALPDPSLPQNGPGRATNFCLSEMTVTDHVWLLLATSTRRV